MGLLDTLSEEDRARLVKLASERAASEGALSEAQQQDKEGAITSRIGEAWRRVGDVYGGTKSAPLPSPQSRVQDLLQKLSVKRQLEEPERQLLKDFAARQTKAAERQAGVEDFKTKEGWKMAQQAPLLEAKRLQETEKEKSRREWEEKKLEEQRKFQAEQNRLGRDVTERAAGAKAQGAVSQAVTDLRKEFQGLQVVKDTSDMASAMEKIRNVTTTGAGDLSLIYSYVKMLDPGSVVREGEIKLSREPTPLLASLVQRYSKAAKGELLHPDLRKAYKDAAEQLWSAQLGRYEGAAKPYVRMAKERGSKPEDVVLDYGYKRSGATDTVKVRYQGKVLAIPASDLQSALADGAEEIQ